MRAVPRGRGAAAGNFAAADDWQTAGLGSAGNRAATRNGAGDARRFNLRARADSFKRAGIRAATLEYFFMSEPLIENHAMDAPQPTIPLPRGPVPLAPAEAARRSVEIKIDGQAVSIPE